MPDMVSLLGAPAPAPMSLTPDLPAGQLVVITGSMFSGKTEELIRRVRRSLYARRSAQVFKPAVDTRSEEAIIQSHNGVVHTALAVADSAEIERRVRPDTVVVAIEEVQFFDSGIVELCQRLADKGHQVIVAGLDMDFRGLPFGAMPTLMAVADEVVKLRAICAVCGMEAARSQRLIDGEPAPASAPTVLIGAEEHYEARCRKHHVVV